jgi:hypothetical protein
MAANRLSTIVWRPVQLALGASSLIAALLAQTHALAARPFVTDDAGTLAAGNCEAQAYGLRQADRGAPSINGVHTDFGCGIGFDHFGATQIGVSAERSVGDGQANTALGLSGKTALRNGFDGAVDFALAYGFNWARGEGERYRHDGAELKAIASATLEPFVLHANAGARYSRADRSSKFIWALAAERPRSLGPVDLGAELFGVAGETAWVQAAMRWELVKERFQIDASIGKEVKHGLSRLVTVGLKASF